jgi:hypothetical protein
VGSSIKTKFEMRDGKLVLARLQEVNFIDDKEGKPVGINSHIGAVRSPHSANSDGGRQVLEWTQACDGACLMLLVHHDDASGPMGRTPRSEPSTIRSWPRPRKAAGRSSA